MRLLKIFCWIVFLVLFNACSGGNCQECTGTNSNGEVADFTVCDNGEGTTRTNNITGTELTDGQTYAAAVAFFESVGLNCE